MSEAGIGSLLGSSPAMAGVREFALRAARVNVPVLILGETGTGKSLLGKVIHAESPWAPGPYQAVNCAGIPETLFESEFFGHQRGAFTGAREGRKGLLEQAQGGSLFLDEVGELSVSQQSKLLTALEDGEIRRIGGEGTIRVHVRIMAATARNLRRDLRTGEFRRDLFHRLAVLTCHLPPLRAHRDDIPLLASRFLGRHQRRHGYPLIPLPRESMASLERQAWPGNIRELSHRLEAALVLSGGEELVAEALEAARGFDSGGTAETESLSFPEDLVDSRGVSPSQERGGEPRRYSFLGDPEEERELLKDALARCNGNKSRAARELGMARNTLRSKLRRYGLG
jgi:DNA-binding NtrC family response regulator